MAGGGRIGRQKRVGRLRGIRCLPSLNEAGPVIKVEKAYFQEEDTDKSNKAVAEKGMESFYPSTTFFCHVLSVFRHRNIVT